MHKYLSRIEILTAKNFFKLQWSLHSSCPKQDNLQVIPISFWVQKIKQAKVGIQKKLRDYLGIFPNMGGGLPNSQNFCYFTIALKKPLKHLKITQKFPTWPK